MDLTVDQFLDGLLSQEAADQPSDSAAADEIVMELPPWYDEKLFNKGRKFFWAHSFSLATSMLNGLVAVFSVPSILKVLVGSRRSTSSYTAYKRYLSTLLHTVSWFENDLKPGSVSWKSLYAVRTRHARASMTAKLQGAGKVSQRDIALTQFGFIGFAILKPGRFGVTALTDDHWEGYNHFWRVIGSMIGLEDRYNLCRKNIDETREVLKAVLDRVFTPCLTNVPEYFEHMSRVMIDGLWSVNPTVDCGAVIYQTKYLADVPGYLNTEEERIAFQLKLKEALKGRPIDTGISAADLISSSAVEGLPKVPLPTLYYHEYDVLHNMPAYKNLSLYEKYKLNSLNFFMALYSTFLGRWYFNLNYLWSLVLMKYFPYIAFFRFGVKASYVSLTVEAPKDDTKPKANAEYYNQKPVAWYWEWLSLFW